jgi:hypothetical protein
LSLLVSRKVTGTVDLPTVVQRLLRNASRIADKALEKTWTAIANQHFAAITFNQSVVGPKDAYVAGEVILSRV